MFEPVLIFVKWQVPVFCLLEYRCRAADGRLRIDQLSRTEVASALLALVTVSSLVVTMGTLTCDIAVGKELVCLFVVELSGSLFCQLAFVI